MIAFYSFLKTPKYISLKVFYLKGVTENDVDIFFLFNAHPVI